MRNRAPVALVLVLAAALLALAPAAFAATTTQVAANPAGGNNDLTISTEIEQSSAGVPIGDVRRVTQVLPSEFVNQLNSFGNCAVSRFDDTDGPDSSSCPNRSSIIGTASLVLTTSGGANSTSDRGFIVKTATNKVAIWAHFTSGGVETFAVVEGNVTQEGAPFGPAVSFDFTALPNPLLLKRVSLTYLRGSAGVAPFAANSCASGTWTFQSRVNYEGATPDQVANATVPCGVQASPPQPSKLELARATIFRSDRVIDIFAPITSRASGNVSLELFAAGQRFRWSAPVDSENARVRNRKRIPSSQARLGTGILTMRYPGDADTRPQVVRLRAANEQARLDAVRPSIENGRLKASGRISSAARGVVRVQLEYFSGGRTTTLERKATISGGRWSLDTPLTAEQQAAIANRAGTVHSYILFTGYLPRRMRGEMLAYQVLGTP